MVYRFCNNYNIHNFLIYSIAKYSFKKAQAKSPLLLNLQSSFSLRIHGKQMLFKKSLLIQLYFNNKHLTSVYKRAHAFTKLCL